MSSIGWLDKELIDIVRKETSFKKAPHNEMRLLLLKFPNEIVRNESQSRKARSIDFTQLLPIADKSISWMDLQPSNNDGISCRFGAVNEDNDIDFSLLQFLNISDASMRLAKWESPISMLSAEQYSNMLFV